MRSGFRLNRVLDIAKRLCSFRVVLLLLISIFAFARLLRPGYFSMQDDVQAFRLYEFDKCVKSFQLPCRWIPDGGAGYGYPLFNYYPPLPYMVGEVIHLFGLGILDSVKFLFVVGFLGAALSMYFLVSRIWGGNAGFLSAIAYLYAPYRAVDSYVRGALNEFWGLSLSPLVLLGTYMVINEKRWGLVVFLVALTSLILTHLVTIFMLIPFLVVWVVYWLVKTKKYHTIYRLIIGLVLSMGISAFSWVPAILEKNLVTMETMTEGFFDYHLHFASLYQLFFSRFWGYGASTWGLSVQIGLLHWILPLVVMFCSLIFVKKRVVKEKLFYLLVILGFSYAFLAHSKSTFIWTLLIPLKFIQFPWRFVGLGVMCFSLALAMINIRSRLLYSIIIVVLVSSSVFYFREDIWYSSLTDTQKLSSSQIILQNVAGLRDYWPIFGQAFPVSQAPAKPRYLEGSGMILMSENGSDWGKYSFDSAVPSTIEIPKIYFPYWRVYENETNKQIPLRVSQPLGLISFNVPAGVYRVTVKFGDTPVRLVANVISLVSLPIAIRMLVMTLSMAKRAEK